MSTKTRSKKKKIIIGSLALLLGVGLFLLTKKDPTPPSAPSGGGGIYDKL